MSNIIKSNNKGGNSNPLDKLRKLKDLKPKISSPKGLQLPRLFYQKVIFLLDASASMTWEGTTGFSKGEEVSDALNKVFKRLKESKHNNCFDISVYTYSSPLEYTKIIDSKPVNKITENNFNPTEYQEPKGTYLCAAYQEALKEAERYFKNNYDKNMQCLIIILSDGGIFDYKRCIELSNNINNEYINVSTIYFEDNNPNNLRDFNTEIFGENYINKHKDILLNIATKESLFHISTNPEEIRKHMIKSISDQSEIDS